MSICHITSDKMFHKSIPFYIGKYYHTDFRNLYYHTHEFIEIVYVCDGRGYHNYNGKIYPVSKGELYIINSGIPHRFYPTDPSNAEHLVVYNLSFLPEFINGMNITLPLLTELTDILLYKSLYAEEIIYTPDLKLSGSMRAEIELLYEKMYLEFTAQNINYHEILQLSLCELLLKIHRFYKINQNHTEVEGSIVRHQLISDCIQYLKDNYAHKITVEDLSGTFFLSKSYLSNLFKKNTGYGIVEYLQHIRINKACDLLTSTDLPVTRIYYQVGFSDYRFFNKAFKKITGMTANEYRKRNRSD